MPNPHSDQNKVNRDPNRSIESRLFDEKSAEETATAFLRERERIRRERRQELEEDKKLWRNKGANPDMAYKLAKDKLKDELINKLPTPLSLPTQIIKFAQDNQLKIQSLLLGLPNELPPTSTITPPNNPNTFTVPTGSGRESYNAWMSYARGFTSPKVLTLTWHYIGWVYQIWQKPSSGSGLIELSNNQGLLNSGNQPTEGLYSDIFKVTLANPELVKKTYAMNNNPRYPSPFLITEGRYAAGYIDTVPTPTKPGYFWDNSAQNNGFTSLAFIRDRFLSEMQLNSSAQISTEVGNRWFYNVSINFRVDLTITGNWADYDAALNAYVTANTWAAWFGLDDAIRAEIAVLLRFESPQEYGNGDSDQGLSPASVLNLPIPPPPTPPPPKPPTPPTPPPPPPKPRCKPMTCCPSQTNGNDEIKRLLNRLIATIGNPVEVTLWDDDLSKPGQQVKKLKPKTSFEHLKSLTERIEVALRIIGITDLPIDVDESRSLYPELGKLYSSSTNPEIRKLGESLLKRDRRTITSVFQALDWYGDAIDEKLGGWESKISFDDIDLVKEGNQNVTLHHANIQDALHDTMKFAFQGGIHSEANLMLMAKTMGEMAVLKKEIVGQSYKLDLLIDYLGMGYTETPEQLPIAVNFSEEAMIKLSNKEMGMYLSDSEIPISKPLLGVNEVNLSVRLAELEQAISTIQAAHRMPVGSIDTIKTMLKRLSKGEDWKSFLDDMQKFSDDNEMQLEIEDITGDEVKK